MKIHSNPPVLYYGFEALLPFSFQYKIKCSSYMYIAKNQWQDKDNTLQEIIKKLYVGVCFSACK